MTLWPHHLQVTYVNGARIIGDPLTATNGFIFLVDDFLCRDPYLTTFAGNVFDYIESKANSVDDNFKTRWLICNMAANYRTNLNSNDNSTLNHTLPKHPHSILQLYNSWPVTFRFSKFMDMLNTYNDNQVNGDMTAVDYAKDVGVTAFVPSDSALLSINANHFNQLMLNKVQLKQVPCTPAPWSSHITMGFNGGFWVPVGGKF